MAIDRFGPEVAERYDDDEAEEFARTEIERTADFLAEQAGGGPVLELGIGTGRIALPLSARGLAVHGIDLSTAMLQRLHAKPGAEAITTTVGDFATTRAPGSYRLAYLIFNTIMNLTSQDEQVACFENVAASLDPGGRFVIEVMVPDLQRLPPGESVRPFQLSADRLGFDEYDLVEQGLISHHYRLDGDRYLRNSIPFRYVWPAELDLMARLAGLRPVHRFASWDAEPFTALSRRHISVWQRPA